MGHITDHFARSLRGTLPVIRPSPSRYKAHPGPYNGKGGRFLPLKRTEKVEYIRPGPSIRYKAMGGLLSVIRPGPYMRGNTVNGIGIKFDRK